MKKITLLSLALFTLLFTSCDNEPVDLDLSNIDPTLPITPPVTPATLFELSSYVYNNDSTLPLIGQIIINMTNNISNNIVDFANVETTFLGTTGTTEGVFTRDSSGKIIGFTNALSDGTIQNTLVVSYSGDDIIGFVFDDLTTDNDDYTCTFVHNGNEVTKTQSNNNVTILYTFENNILKKKESTEAGTVLQTQTFTYDVNGNCSMAEITGEGAVTYAYSYDTYTNPLKVTYADQYRLSIFNEDYDSNMGATLAQFHSTNNLNALAIDGATAVPYIVNYDTDNRIISRDYNFSDPTGTASLMTNEIFTYVN